MARKSTLTAAPSAGAAVDKRFTIAHVTHEAVEQLGGIGTVLEGMITSPVYQTNVQRSILVGPTSTHSVGDPRARLGEQGEVLYSSIDNVDKAGLAHKLRPVEWAFNTPIVYGRRTYNPPGQGRSGEAEVLLIDVFAINQDRLNRFKYHLGERFDLTSWRYESNWDFEEYMRLAEPAYYALLALLKDEELPALLFSHEFMGMPTALAAIMEGQDKFRTVFHAHECSTARRIVEDHPGHDTMFYNVLDQAVAKGQYLGDVFGDKDDFFRHALIRRTHLCDGLIAVGDRTRDEFKFISSQFDDHPIDLVYNGLPVFKVDAKTKDKSRTMLVDYAQTLVGFRPDVLMTHVTRPVISKAMWRDVQVCEELDKLLGAQGKTGALFILTTGGGVRRPQDVEMMERSYGWPRHHREGYPDLVGPEVGIGRHIQAFNAEHQNVQIVLVNQFGWSSARIGKRLPKGMDIADLRRATDVEFGMATYEPFGISPLEPLGSGAICVISSVCGCCGFVNHVTRGKGTPNVIVADYTRLDRPMSIAQLTAMTQLERDQVEQRVSQELAQELVRRLPTDDKGRTELLRAGQALVAKMGWDQVLAEGMLPMLDRIRSLPQANGKEKAERVAR
ncbi:MAG: hypothetical protein WD042_08160 [Phycisphaeraceae bacterium]